MRCFRNHRQLQTSIYNAAFIILKEQILLLFLSFGVLFLFFFCFGGCAVFVWVWFFRIIKVTHVPQHNGLIKADDVYPRS